MAGQRAADRSVVGYAVTGRAGTRGYLQRLAVAPATTNGRGIGTALVVDGLRWLRRWGAKEVLVNTQEANEAAVQLYEPLGFELRPRAWPCSASSLGDAAVMRRASSSLGALAITLASAPPPAWRQSGAVPGRRSGPRPSSWSSQTPVAPPGGPSS